MGNDNWDRINSPSAVNAVVIAAMLKMNLVSLEEKCNELWGDGNFDWVIGSAQDPGGNRYWFYYAGDAEKPGEHGRWKVGGSAKTIADALMALIKEYDDGA
jgi:hypothetical protein